MMRLNSLCCYTSLLIRTIALIMGFTFACSAFGLVDSAQLEEIWLEPAKQDANSTVGNWGVAKLLSWYKSKETHFAFHVPENFDESNQEHLKAVIVLIPSTDGYLRYTAKLNVASEGDAHYSLQTASRI